MPNFKSPTVPKMKIYSVIPYIRDTFFQNKLKQIISSHIGAIDVKLIPMNPLKIGSFFKVKDQTDYLMSSGVVYKYTCPRCDRGTYIGSTHRLLKVRIDAHRGVSYRTGTQLTNPEFSSIREHTKICKCPMQYKDFEIIARASNNLSLSILESLTIKQTVPSLNTQTSSTHLYLA